MNTTDRSSLKPLRPCEAPEEVRRKMIYRVPLTTPEEQEIGARLELWLEQQRQEEREALERVSKEPGFPEFRETYLRTWGREPKSTDWDMYRLLVHMGWIKPKSVNPAG